MTRSGAYATFGEASVKSRFFSFRGLPVAVLALNRKPSLPVSRMWQWCVRRSSSAVVYILHPDGTYMSPRTRVFIDWAAEVLGRELTKERSS